MIGREKDHNTRFSSEIEGRCELPPPPPLITHGLCLKTHSDAELYAIFSTIMMPKNGA